MPFLTVIERAKFHKVQRSTLPFDTGAFSNDILNSQPPVARDPRSSQKVVDVMSIECHVRFASRLSDPFGYVIHSI